MLLEGEILFQTGAERFTVNAGEAIFIDPGEIHAAYPLGGEPCRFCALVFHPEFLASAQYDTVQQLAVSPFREKRLTFPRKLTPGIDWHRELLAQLRRMTDAWSGEMPGLECFVKASLLLMLSLIAPEGRGAVRSTDNAEADKVNRLKIAIEHIQDSYREQIRIRRLAELTHMSEGQFCRFFKAMTRKTPVDYINSYRISRAAGLLQSTKRQISDIALDVGFDNVSYFIKVFRRTMNCTPQSSEQAEDRRTAWAKMDGGVSAID